MFEKFANKVLSMGLVCILLISSVACSQQSVLNDLEKYAPLAVNVLVVACSFEKNPVCSLAPKIQADEQILFTDWQNYINAVNAGTETQAAWNDLNAALTVLVNDSQSIFAFASSLGANVSPADQAEVLAIAVAAQSLLAIIESQLPASPSGAVRTAILAKKLPAPNPKTGKYDAAWFKKFKKDFNSHRLVKAKKIQLH